jgi:hypothetical protein
MGSKRKVIQVFKNNPRGTRLLGRPKTDGGIKYNQIRISEGLKIGKRGRKIRADWEKSIKEVKVHIGM